MSTSNNDQTVVIFANSNAAFEKKIYPSLSFLQMDLRLDLVRQGSVRLGSVKLVQVWFGQIGFYKVGHVQVELGWVIRLGQVWCNRIEA